MENAGREPEKGGTSDRRARQIFAHRILSENPLLIALLGLYPVAAACHTLKNALELSVMLAVLIPPAAVLFCCVGGRIPLWLRPAAVLACSAVLYLPAAGLMELIFPGAVNELGIFAGLMVCNSMMLSRLTEYAPGHSGREVAADAAGCALGYCLMMCLTAAIREFIRLGGVWNDKGASFFGVTGKSTLAPFFGFLLVGFLAALAQHINLRREERAARVRRRQAGKEAPRL